MSNHWDDVPDRKLDEIENDQRQWDNQEEEKSIDDQEYDEGIINLQD